MPADEKRVWTWRRGETGKRKWLRGTEAQARADGVVGDVTWPEGVWRAPCGDWFAVEDGREPCGRIPDWGSPNQEFMASLPRDPDKLLALIRERFEGATKHTPDLLVMLTASEFLGTGLVPADLRATVYRMLAKLPTVEVTEQFANVDGREGTAFGVSDGRVRLDVIIDPKTGRYIGERNVLVAPRNGVEAGTVFDYSAVDIAIVDGMGETPAG
ncbi:hypothetical protein [Actinophytocola sp.]|uniref:hypothetical protein n=1 Tax=Actinophytocola sp. TaxID=1872138 RepID=UPI003D6C2BDD